MRGMELKVLHIIGGGDVGGAKTHVLLLAKALGQRIPVKIVCLRPGVFADEADALGIDVEVVKSGNIASDIRRVVAIVSEGGYKIVHSHGAKANMVSLAVKAFTGAPTVTTIHSDYKLDYMHSFARRISFGTINTIALRFIDYYIGVSDNFADMLIKRRFMPDHIYTLYNGMDFDAPPAERSREGFVSQYGFPIAPDDIIVGIAARLYPVKGLDTLIRAAAAVRPQDAGVKFVIGGDGEDRASLEGLSRSLGLEDTVFFTGWLSDVDALMGIVDISVLTSISESFPYSILEGARFSKATVSSCVGGIPSLIRHGSEGLLFEPGDHMALAAHILQLARDGGARDALGRNLHARAKERFSLSRMCETQLSIYRAVAENSFAPRSAAAQRQANAGAGISIGANANTNAGADIGIGANANTNAGAGAGARARKRASAKEYDMLISGYYGFGNIGDDAMLSGIIEAVRKLRPGSRVAILSKDPVHTALTYRVNAFNRLNVPKAMRVLWNTRLFAYGGGNIIQDSTSTRSLLFYLASALMAKLMGARVMFLGNGFGPLNKPLNKRLSSKALNAADAITVREELSLHELESIGVTKPPITLTADPALLISYRGDDGEAAETRGDGIGGVNGIYGVNGICGINGINGIDGIDSILMAEGIPLGRTYVGFSVREYPVPGGEWAGSGTGTGNNIGTGTGTGAGVGTGAGAGTGSGTRAGTGANGDGGHFGAGVNAYLRAFAKAADALAEQYGVTPVFLPMEYPRDLRPIDAVLSQMRSEAYAIRNRLTLRQTLGVISRMEMMVAMRLHALIFAANLGVPVVCVEYQPKIEGFAKYIGQPSAGKMEHLKPEALYSLMAQVWESREEIRAKLIESMAALREKSWQNAVIAARLIDEGRTRGKGGRQSPPDWRHDSQSAQNGAQGDGHAHA